MLAQLLPGARVDPRGLRAPLGVTAVGGRGKNGAGLVPLPPRLRLLQRFRVTTITTSLFLFYQESRRSFFSVTHFLGCYSNAFLPRALRRGRLLQCQVMYREKLGFS